MALLFEFCFYLGAGLTLTAIIWLLRCVIGGRLKRALVPAVMLLVGAMCVIGPAVVSRNMEVDLGPRETIVEGERHVSLTGWDGDSYDFLARKTDTIVLQMGNADVTDATLELLLGMSQLRELDVNDSAITDAGLAKLANLKALRTLRLRATKITDAGFRQHLATMPTLQQIDLRETAVSSEAVGEWKSAADGRKAFQS